MQALVWHQMPVADHLQWHCVSPCCILCILICHIVFTMSMVVCTAGCILGSVCCRNKVRFTEVAIAGARSSIPGKAPFCHQAAHVCRPCRSSADVRGVKYNGPAANQTANRRSTGDMKPLAAGAARRSTGESAATVAGGLKNMKI